MSGLGSVQGIFPLSSISDEQLDNFDCGKLSLNIWLSSRARANEANGGSRTYVLLSSTGEIVGFYCLSNHCLSHRGIRAVLRRNMPDPIPAILLGRLAVSVKYQGKGIGTVLLRHSIETSQKVSQITGASLLVVHPLDDLATQFYLRAGFERMGKELPFLAIKLYA